MTPKEKATELVKKFTYNTRCFSETKGWEDTLYDAKQCALIAVDEILNEYWLHDTKRRDWWQEVKHEIEKL